MVGLRERLLKIFSALQKSLSKLVIMNSVILIAGFSQTTYLKTRGLSEITLSKKREKSDLLIT